MGFPTLTITKSAFLANGEFAETQARYLEPDPGTVRDLEALVRAKNVGIVAHFYMDAELQGVVSSLDWPHVHISDSLVMADRAVKMARDGAQHIVVLGVDFMSENARAMLDAAGFQHVPVYRAAIDPIGCTLAASAETLEYAAYIERAARVPNAMHVVYINTSLRTKAHAHSKVPTITVTSSNVVRTVLSAFVEIPDVHVFFGPDTYMGQNLERLFRTAIALGDDAVRHLHPALDAAKLRDALTRFEYFKQGNCAVHQLFGSEVAARIRDEHGQDFLTAHLEVPGEMFELALEAARAGRGVVGSTSDILGFIVARVREALGRDGASTLRFVLGTETGMITSIVRDVQRVLAESSRDDVHAEIVFPVSSEAITTTNDPGLLVVPGAAGGEGCSVEGGCAACPYMKMNSLDALFALVARIGVEDDDRLAGFHPQTYPELVDGRTVVEVGSEPILHMRAFQTEGKISSQLAHEVTTRRPKAQPRA